jgi:hypothetical protein
MSRLLRTNVVLVVLATTFVFLAVARSEAADYMPAAKVGREGSYLLRSTDAGLIVREAKERSPVIVRIANAARDGEAWIYDLRFVGSQPGRHDLREYLARSDGKALSAETKIPVNIEGLLPAEHDGSLQGLEIASRPRVLPYRRMLQGGLIAWLGVTCVLAYRGWRRRGPVKKTATVEEPADPLPILIEQALANQLDATSQARLEMLLLLRCQASLELDKLPPDEALRQMRSHPDSRRLLSQLEDWLHAAPGSRRVDLAALLLPYRTSAAGGSP